jgi:oxygen-independent coproporphyrinogen-3 oxidase
MEGYFESVVEVLEGHGYRWYETANFCRKQSPASGRDLRAQHNLAVWRGHDYLGIGIGAVSTVRGVRRRNRPGLRGYVEALSRREAPPREHEDLDEATRSFERLMLGLRLDEPLPLAGVVDVLDVDALARLERQRLLERVDGAVRLTPRGRRLGGGVTAELVA